MPFARRSRPADIVDWRAALAALASRSLSSVSADRVSALYVSASDIASTTTIVPVISSASFCSSESVPSVARHASRASAGGPRHGHAEQVARRRREVAQSEIQRALVDLEARVVMRKRDAPVALPAPTNANTPAARCW